MTPHDKERPTTTRLMTVCIKQHTGKSVTLLVAPDLTVEAFTHLVFTKSVIADRDTYDRTLHLRLAGRLDLTQPTLTECGVGDYTTLTESVRP